MKIQRYIFVMLLVSLSLGVQARNSVKEMTVNGLKVVFMPSSKQTVAAIMFFKGGTANYDEKQQGIGALTLAATSDCGTQKYAKDAFKNMADKYGVSVSGSAGYDYSSISLECVKPYFSEGWKLFSEAVNHPVFEKKELGLLKQKLIAGIQNRKSNPDNTLSDMCMKNTFQGTRYAYQVPGTVETMKAFTQDDVKNYYNKLLNANKMVLVIVGNLKEQDIRKMVEKDFGNLPSTPVEPMPAAIATTIDTNSLNTESRKLSTNYIQGMLGAPAFTSPDSYAFRLAFNILRNKLFEEVRTKRNLSYAPQAFSSTGFIPYSAVYVTTTKPNEAVTVMVNEMDTLKNDGFTDVDLRNSKSEYTTYYFMGKQSTYNTAYSLGVAKIKGSIDMTTHFIDHIDAVTLAQMQKIFSQYVDGINWNYLGDESVIDKDVFNRKVK
ncbi:M16 family metallopeptidase [Prolixibacter denitrificans]|nr:pitrilysin family protein [Prolixibacter denitrificans]PSK83183.1 putative Zn-dependent peptidase [Prolixibacter denitrificans]